MIVTLTPLDVGFPEHGPFQVISALFTAHEFTGATIGGGIHVQLSGTVYAMRVEESPHEPHDAVLAALKAIVAADERKCLADIVAAMPAARAAIAKAEAAS